MPQGEQAEYDPPRLEVEKPNGAIDAGKTQSREPKVKITWEYPKRSATYKRTRNGN